MNPKYTAKRPAILALAILTLFSLAAARSVAQQDDLPAPVLVLKGTETYVLNGIQFTSYLLSITNRDSFPDALFEAAPDLPPCGLNNNASRTWVEIYAENGRRLYGFCALKSASALDRLWFAVPQGQQPPDKVYVTLDDRRLNKSYRSNSVSVTAPITLANVSAASFLGAELAAESIVAAFGVNLAASVESANTTPLPTTLAGTKVTVKDSAGLERLSPLFFVAPSQVNYQIPAGTTNGAATVTITSSDGKTSVSALQIASVAPGLFTANANGLGVPAATVFRLRANGTTANEPIAQFDSTLRRFVPLPIDLGPEGDQVFIVLFGTGFRNNTGLSSVSVKIGGVDSQVLYAGITPGFVGLDQANARIPRSLAGRGEVDLVMTANEKVANTVRISIK